jgi:hypothetical protein
MLPIQAREASCASTVPAFAEEGKAASIPGPLIRVPAGTSVVLDGTTRLDSATDHVVLITSPATPEGAAAPGAVERERDSGRS